MTVTNQTRRPTRLAFTLAELTIVVLIIGIMSAAAMPKLTDALMFYRAKAAAMRIQADLKYARETARTNNADETVSFNVSNDQYSLSSARNVDRPSQAYTVDIGGTVYRATIVSADFSSSTDVTFNAYGMPDSGGLVTVAAGESVFVVELDADSGKATVTQQ